MEEKLETINQVLVTLFNQLTRIEENTLRREGLDALSMREIHIIEAVCAAGEDSNNMAALAETLRITAGSLTVAVNTLVRKGYLTRERSKEDKRRILVLPTESALAAEKIHREYHRKMTQAVNRAVSDDQIDVLLDTLKAIQRYFYDQEEQT